MNTKANWLLLLLYFFTACSPASTYHPSETDAIPSPIFTLSPIPPTITTTPIPPIQVGSGRITLNFVVMPEVVILRKINDDFLFGVGTTDERDGWVSDPFLRTLRLGGVNYFLPFTSWAGIEQTEGSYTGIPAPGKDFIDFAAGSGAVLNGHCTLFLINQSWSVPLFANDHSFQEQKNMIGNFIRSAVQQYPQIGIWTLNEPIATNALGWSRDEIYDVFVSASKWIHEENPNARVMINMIPTPNTWSGLYYDPIQVLDDLIVRGVEIDIIGIELYQEDSYPSIDWVMNKVDLFRKYDLPIIFSEVGVSGVPQGFDSQANWLEDVYRYALNDPIIIGTAWYFMRDQSNGWDYGLANDDYSLRLAGERLLEIIEEVNPSSSYSLNNQTYLDIKPGTYDVIIGSNIYRVTITARGEKKITRKFCGVK
jgi:hypothetical protein